jgi:hypothetical protein
MVRLGRFLAIATVAAGLIPAAVFADPLTTTHYRLDPDVDASFGGQGSSTHYGLVDSGGEAAAGEGSSASYKLGAGYVPSLTQSIQLAVLPNGITAYYPLDTGVGDQAYDSGASARNGTLQNSPTWTTGQIGGALSFNGTSQYVSTSASFTNPSAFTLELWFKTNTSAGGRLIGFGDAATGASTNADRTIYMTNAGNLKFGVDPGTKHYVTSTSTYNNNAWHHVAATFGSGGMHLYVDGASSGTPDSNTSAGNYTGYWRMAYDTLSGWNSAPTSNYFSGNLDEVKIYSRELSATEVANEYTAGGAGVVSAQTIPAISAGISSTALTDVIVRTDAGGYTLAINQDHNLTHTDTVTTIPAVSYSIGSGNTGLWTEGTTKGLGFTLVAASGIESWWGSSPNYKYAAIPGAATTFHSHTGFLSGTPETNTVQFRLDVSPSQKSGTYSNTATFTATEIP